MSRSADRVRRRGFIPVRDPPVTSDYKELILWRSDDKTDWKFDDLKVGLFKEPFIRGSSEIIDAHIKMMGRPRSSMAILRFNSAPFINYDFKIARKDAKLEGGGAWYVDSETGLSGWLCPNTLKYFKGFPNKIYLSIVA